MYLHTYFAKSHAKNNVALPDNTEKMMKFDNTGWNEKMKNNTDTHLRKCIYMKHIATIL